MINFIRLMGPMRLRHAGLKIQGLMANQVEDRPSKSMS